MRCVSGGKGAPEPLQSITICPMSHVGKTPHMWNSGAVTKSDFGTFCPSQVSYFTGSDSLLKNKKEIKIQFHIFPSR